MASCWDHISQDADQMEVYVDSGSRRGTDILKTVFLGATAVGMKCSMLFPRIMDRRKWSI